jgi:hypothetical protein
MFNFLHSTKEMNFLIRYWTMNGRSKSGVLVARTLGSWVRIPLEAGRHVCMYVRALCRSRPCDGPTLPISRSLPNVEKNSQFQKLLLLDR